MSRTFEQIIAALDALKAEDFDGITPGVDGIARLEELTQELMRMRNPAAGVQALFDVMERLPKSDLGMPGPIVHMLETLVGSYEHVLVESLGRKPVRMTVWMVNRIMNGYPLGPDDWQICLDLLGDVSDHPAADEATRNEALYYIEYQVKKKAAKAP